MTQPNKRPSMSMSGQQTARASFRDLPSKYWSTLTHHGHPTSSNPLTLETELERLGEIHINSACHDTAYFSDFTYHKTLISPSARTCSSLLSEMLRPAAGSHPSSPATTHGEVLSDHDCRSAHSTPPLLATPPKQTHISFGLPVSQNLESSIQTPPEKAPLTISTTELRPQPLKGTRHISFGGVTSSPSKPVQSHTASDAAQNSSDDVQDFATELTPVPKRTIQFAAGLGARELAHRTVSDLSDQPSDEYSNTSSRSRSIRFAGSCAQTKSVESSRKSSYSEGHNTGLSGDESSRVRSISQQTSGANSPVIPARAGPATCKSTLDAMLKKEAIAQVIDTVPEEEDEDDDDEEEDDADNDDIDSILELDSDDDGYQEDVESDDDMLDEDIYPPAGSGTPRVGFAGKIDTARAQEAATNSSHDLRTPVFRTAAPSESDLPDTTDFAPGTIDEDQPACIAFDMAIRDREARRRPAKPSDIDPTFPDSGTEEDSDDNVKPSSPAITGTGRPMCRSPPGKQRLTCRQRWNSPPIAKAAEFRATSLPRRYLTGRKGLYAPKPQRAVTIKQSNEQRAQRRREKKEVRHNLRRGKQEVDHTGHEKMKVHCLSHKKLIAEGNPCVIRPVMSI